MQSCQDRDTKVKPHHLQIIVGTDLLKETNHYVVCSDEMQIITLNAPQGRSRAG